VSQGTYEEMNRLQDSREEVDVTFFSAADRCRSNSLFYTSVIVPPLESSSFFSYSYSVFFLFLLFCLKISLYYDPFCMQFQQNKKNKDQFNKEKAFEK
jgi:hypothetical protein